MDAVEYTINGIKGGTAKQLYKGADRGVGEKHFADALRQPAQFDSVQKLDSLGNDFRQFTRPSRPSPYPVPAT